jgi:hypothetical protein
MEKNTRIDPRGEFWAIVKERDTGLESTKIWYLFSPLFRGADN